MKKNILRVLASGLGLLIIVLSYQMLVNAFSDDALSNVNAITGILIGSYFVLYGITGTSNLLKWFEKTSKPD